MPKSSDGRGPATDGDDCGVQFQEHLRKRRSDVWNANKLGETRIR